MALLGKLLRRFRAGAAKSPLAAADYASATTLAVVSSAFGDGAAIPTKYAGPKAGGSDVSPPLSWSGAPAGTAQYVVLMEDFDVPGPKPLMHTTAVLDPAVTALAEGELKAGTTGVRLVKAFGEGYVGPAPIAGHGPHHYRFTVLALDTPVPAGVADHNDLLAAAAGHVVARGAITGTYER